VLEQVFWIFFVLVTTHRVVIDLDVTDDPVHGQQAMAFFNRYYDSVCYAPLYIFAGGICWQQSYVPRMLTRQLEL